MAIESESYAETVKKFKEDPIIKEMAAELRRAYLRRPSEYIHPEETDGLLPRYTFMVNALYEYRARGGKINGHLGGPARAVVELIEEGAIS